MPLMSFPSPVTPKCLPLLELMSIPEADRDSHYALLFVLSSLSALPNLWGSVGRR